MVMTALGMPLTAASSAILSTFKPRINEMKRDAHSYIITDSRNRLFVKFGFTFQCVAIPILSPHTRWGGSAHDIVLLLRCVVPSASPHHWSGQDDGASE
jgi:hypothetical protein